ncbi:hypothetical protein LF65_05684 [Clostridium beijerinckii]|uniref:Uncharacterized protein n=1 Tax=Clostridium beijerinckii TaxID=1520 RepID=A0A0B5QMZ8_CLOBE|nr:hypothetical protein [Clostridium beijerinckii]AJH02191.1 hypothetical protein LF65_05684 [Clostridium beijerinckii]
MIKLIKEIFNTENLKKAMVYGAMANPNIGTVELEHLSNVLRNMDVKNINKSINKEVNIKKVA